MSTQSNYLDLNKQLTFNHPSLQHADYSNAPGVLLSFIENVFAQCIRLKDPRGVQALACLNRNFYEKVKHFVKEEMSKPARCYSLLRGRLLKVESFQNDQRADLIFQILRRFLFLLNHTKINFFLVNNPQEQLPI